MSDLTPKQLDELADRIAAKLQSQEEAEANRNPNEYLLPVLERMQGKDHSAASILGAIPETPDE